MPDDVAPVPSPEAVRCTWCSAILPDPGAATCPTCGATLVGEGDPQLPGVTALDSDAIVRAARAPLQRPRSRLLSWISGEYDEDYASQKAAPGSLAPPPPDVRREMLKLEIAADLADLEAEAGAIVADAELEARESGRAPTAGASSKTGEGRDRTDGSADPASAESGEPPSSA